MFLGNSLLRTCSVNLIFINYPKLNRILRTTSRGPRITDKVQSYQINMKTYSFSNKISHFDYYFICIIFIIDENISLFLIVYKLVKCSSFIELSTNIST